jgi:hypothetical protein
VEKMWVVKRCGGHFVWLPGAVRAEVREAARAMGRRCDNMMALEILKKQKAILELAERQHLM